MRAIQVGGTAAALVMLAVILWAGSQSSITEGFSVISEQPWGIVSLVDLYVGLVIAAAWVVYRESSPLSATLWVVAVAVLGNLAVGVYVAMAATQAIRRKDTAVFFRGDHATTSN